MSLGKKIGIIAIAALAALILLFIYLPVVAWILVGLVVLIIAVVLLVPIGADVAYIDEKFRLALRVDGFAIQLLPKKEKKDEEKKEEEKPKKEKEKKEPEEKKPEEEKKPRKFNFTKEELLELAKKAIKGLGKFGKFTVRKFMLHFTAAGQDPYNTVMFYNYVNGALCILAPICRKHLDVKDNVDVWTNVDFTTDKIQLDTELSVTLRLIQVVRAALAVAVGVIGVLIKNKRRLKKEEKLAKKNGEPPPDKDKQDEQTTDTEIEITKEEERKDSNG